MPPRGLSGQPGSTGTTAETFIFAGSSDPVMLDPAMASDGETFRIARQIFEGLVTVEPGSTELAPLLGQPPADAPRAASA